MNKKSEFQRANTTKQLNISKENSPKIIISQSTSIGFLNEQSNYLSKSLVYSPSRVDYSFDRIIEQSILEQRVKNLPTNANDQEQPTKVFCQKCQKQVITRIEKQYGCGALIVTFLILMIFWPLFWIPCFVSECRDIIHYCPSCEEVIGLKPYKLCK
ncbi:unnamed protein product [Paramecium pentaurelia]|uniref:LITAF domain-containing protein n=1 Tax=Paramecium pentaurelia TaxID=43138 RepID=A0A8S1Y400_9CILI|nr:unnamed protein product [Paramecium pentaurelia]